MKYTLAIGLAKGLVIARWRQTMVAAIGVTFGIAMFITLLSFMGGLNRLLDGLVLNRTPHIRLFNEIKPNPLQPINLVENLKGYHHFISSTKADNARWELYNSISIIQSLKSDERVKGCTPHTAAQVFFNYGTLNINGIINGIDVLEESRLFAFNDYVVEGKAMDLNTVPNSIILGKSLGERMEVTVGETVVITTAAGERYNLRVCGFFQSGINEADKVQCYAALSTVQKILGRPNSYITEIAIKIKDFDAAPAMAHEFSQVYNTDAEDIQTANAQFDTGSRIRSIISYSVGITLLIVAGFGIYNILNMMIYEKMDSIAILKATGFAGSDVKKIFLFISIGIGLVGGLAGLLLGYLLSVIINHIPFTTVALPTVKTYPVYYNPFFYLVGISFALITTYFAGYFPARKAAKIDPVIIIRGK